MNFVEPIRSKKDIETISNYLLNRSKRDYLLFVVGINTALRISDLIRLKYADLQNNHITIYERKTGKRNQIFINDKIKSILKSYADEFDLKPNNYIFYSQKNRRKHIDRVQAWRIISDATINCNIDGNFGTHTLRKTFCYHAYKETKDIGAIMTLLNHTNLESTFRYLGINQDRLDELHKSVVL